MAAAMPAREVDRAYEQLVAAREKADAAERKFETELLGQNRLGMVTLLKDLLDAANRQLEEAQRTNPLSIFGTPPLPSLSS